MKKKNCVYFVLMFFGVLNGMEMPGGQRGLPLLDGFYQPRYINDSYRNNKILPVALGIHQINGENQAPLVIPVASPNPEKNQQKIVVHQEKASLYFYAV